jgi:amino acid permease
MDHRVDPPDAADGAWLDMLDEVLDTAPTKRANTLLYLIENRTALAALRRTREASPYLSFFSGQRSLEEGDEQDLAFFEAFTRREPPPKPPTLRDLERYADDWAALVPEGARLQAALAHVVGKKYRLIRRNVPQLRAALGLDQPAVQEAYQRLYDVPLDSIYTTEITLRERLVWAWVSLASRLEHLPPFWAAFAMTLTETVGAGVLALPIALASIGTLPGVVILVVLGLINVLTIMYMAEAMTRSGRLRYLGAFIGNVAHDLLGQGASQALSLGGAAIAMIIQWVYFLGLSQSLSDAFGISPIVWMVALFGVCVYFVTRGSLASTFASALMVGFINIGILVVIMVLAVPHIRPANVGHINLPFLAGQPFDAAVLGLVFGVALAAFFGHFSVGMVANNVLKRDPSGRSLIHGTSSGTLTAIALYGCWLLVVNGAIAPDLLAAELGTALRPLATLIGPIIHVLGSLFALLSMGMVAIHTAIALYKLVEERLPKRTHPTLTLPRRRGYVRLAPRRGATKLPALHLTYIGYVRGQPAFHIEAQQMGKMGRDEVRITKTWAADPAALPRVAAVASPLGAGFTLTVDVIESGQDFVRLRLGTSWRVSYHGEWDTGGLTLSDALDLPEPLPSVINWMLKQPDAVRIADVAAHFKQDHRAARLILEALQEQGFVAPTDNSADSTFEVRLAARRGRKGSKAVWDALLDDDTQPQDADPTQATQAAQASRLDALLMIPGVRAALCLSPLGIVLLLSVYSAIMGSTTFAAPLSFVGTVVCAVFAGLFPPLLLVASRRKGEVVPGHVYRALGHPIVAGMVFSVFMLAIVLHGTIIWSDPAQRLAALAVAALMMVLVVRMIRRGVFRPSLSLVMCSGVGSSTSAPTTITMTYAGAPLVSETVLEYADGQEHLQTSQAEVPRVAALRRATVTLSVPGAAPRAAELRLMAVRETLDQRAEVLPAYIEVQTDGAEQPKAFTPAEPHLVLPHAGTRHVVTFTFHQASP